MNSKIILVLLLFASVGIQAQRGGGQRGTGEGMIGIKAKGQVIDDNSGMPLEYATISVFSMRDSSLVGGGLSDSEGMFSVDIRPGKMYGVVEFLGYEALRIADISMTRDQIQSGQREIDLGILKMTEGGTLLDEVEIRAEKSETQFSLDKRVFNVGQDLANRGGTAEDILNNVPSVSVDIEGAVSLRGSEGVRILIDGKPSGLVGNGNANGLRSIPSNMIEKVEVVTNPSARYDAEGMAGIINIVLKKDTGSGFNGSFDLTGGYPGQFGVGMNVNYRKNNLNWFLNIGLSKRTNPGSGYFYSERNLRDTLFISENFRTQNRGGLSNSIRFGADYFLSQKENITTAFLYRKSNEDNESTLNYNDYLFNYPENRVDSYYRYDDQEEREKDIDISILYNKEFSSREHALSATAQYSKSTETQKSDYSEGANVGNVPNKTIAIPTQRSDNTEGEKNWLFKMDYTKPLGNKDHRYELGSQVSIRNISNDYLVEEIQDDVWQNLNGLSNDFQYNENILAFYSTYGNRYGKFSYQAGLRFEASQVKTELIETNEINDRSYSNFFPSLHLNYDLAANHALQVSYSRRLRRPHFRMLNPFFSFSDNRNFFTGNPNLDPEYTDSYEVGQIKYWDNLTLSTSIFYRHSTGDFQYLRTLNADGTTISKPQNLGTRDESGLEVTAQYKGGKWLRLDANVNLFQLNSSGTFEGLDFSTENFTWSSRFTSQVTFWSNTDLQIRYNYRGPRNTAQGSRRGAGSLDLGLTKDFLSNNLSATLSVNDVFNSRKRIGVTDILDYYDKSEFQWRSRSTTLTLSYRLNQKKKKNQRSRGEGGGGDEGPEF